MADHGKDFTPHADGANNDLAPKDLDTYKRGYSERATLRERDTGELDAFRHRDKGRNPEQGSNAINQLVERICVGQGYGQAPRGHRGVNIAEELDRMMNENPKAFKAGKSLTTILSLLARRRNMDAAMKVWSWMKSAKVQRSVFHYNSLISVCEKCKDWRMALDLMKEMDEQRIEKNQITYSSAISACEKSGNFQVAIDLLDRMENECEGKSVIPYNAAISACEKGLNSAKALQVFDRMKKRGVIPTVITYSALISACEKCGQWKLALEVLEWMKKDFGTNVIAYSAAIAALSKGQQWEIALKLFRELQSTGSNPSVVTYNTTMTALEKGLQWKLALDLFDEMKQKNLPVTVVSFGSAISACEKGFQWKQCLDYLDEMTERGIEKNVIIFGAAMSCMEKCKRADIAFQLMERMKLEGVRANVHIYNCAITACARCNLPEKGYEIFMNMDRDGVKRDIVTYNAVLDAAATNIELARSIFHDGVKIGYYAKVSRLGEHWLELDLHFLSLGGGEIAMWWWFEECLVPYLVNSDKLAKVKAINIVTGYGKTRKRESRKGDDGMRKRVLAMMTFMRLKEVQQPNMGRVQLNIQAFIEEVRRNDGKILFDSNGYRRFLEKETGSNEHEEVEQIRRPKVSVQSQMVDRNAGTSFGGRSGGDRRQIGNYGRGRSNGRNEEERFGRGGDRRSFHESEDIRSEGHYGPNSSAGLKRERSPSQDSRYNFRRSGRGRGFGGDGYQNRRGRGRGGYRGRGRSGGRGDFDRRQGNEGSSRNNLDWQAPPSQGPPAQSLQWEAPPKKNLQWEAPPRQNIQWEAPPRTEPHQGNPDSSHSSRGYNL